MEKTLIIVKPDGVQRRLVGRIVARFEQKGLRIAAMKLRRVPRATIEEHYAEHRGKPFFDDLVEFMSGGPVVLLALEGQNAIAVSRKLVGATRASEAEPGTIRGDHALSGQLNLVHASDSPASAERELAIFFDRDEIVEYSHSDARWLEG